MSVTVLRIKCTENWIIDGYAFHSELSTGSREVWFQFSTLSFFESCENQKKYILSAGIFSLYTGAAMNL